MNPLDWSLVGGPLPVVLLAGCVLSLLVLVAGGTWRKARWRWWVLWLPLIAVTTAGIIVLLDWLISYVWRPFEDTLPVSVLVWCWIGLLGVVLAVACQPRVRSAGHLGVLLAGVVVLATAAAEVNIYYQAYPSLRTVLGPLIDKKPALPGSVQRRGAAFGAGPDQILASSWHPPANMPKAGQVYQANIPGTVSGFKARPGYVYLPPAYLATPRAQLPVIVLLAGQPGDPRQWLDSGGIASMMDSFAARHQGLAPVVVIPDDLGSELANPLCLDSRLGNAQTYLTADVPHWVTSHLQVRPPDRGWAIAGFSHGGTCSIQLAIQAPKLYPIFDSISGEQAPTLGTRQRTIKKAFGGDAAAYAKVNPMDVLARTRFPGTAGIFVGGSGDHVYTPQQEIIYRAAKQAGMDVTLQLIPGGHNWQVWRAGLQRNIGWLAARLKIT